MGQLLSCPFCRELFSQDEGPNCPECELPLVPLNKLPLSMEAQADLLLAEGMKDPPEDQRLPLLYFGRNRGVGMALCIVGLFLFFTPWVSLDRPDEVTLSGHDLARAGAPWLWGGAVGWFVLFPLLASRRTVNQLRGIRVMAVFFPLLTLGEVGMLLFNPPQAHRFFGSGLEFGWGIFASGVVALLAMAVGARLGGSLEDLRDLPLQVPVSGPVPGEEVH